ncbi:WHY1 [Blepharisma stoltei]|uniref:Uncharacterized protein n=1 Tax=Blepharisma stoltei TaxID=1481888 RepID=A0AAU9JTK4_9CILI|nr:unnamed protein product [Blepharisma stoltei]
MNKLCRFFASLNKIQTGTDKKAYVGYIIYRDSVALSVSPLKAKFTMSTGGYLKNAKKGALLVEFIPYRDDPIDNQRLNLLPKEKKMISLTEDHIIKLIALKEESLEFQRNNRWDEKKLTVSKQAELWKFTLATINRSTELLTKSEISLKPQEFSMIKRLCEFSMPYIQGWQVLENPQLADGLIISPEELKKPQNDDMI